MLDERYHLKIIDFGTADVQLIEGKNDTLFKEYIRIREKHAPKYESEPINNRDSDDEGDAPKKMDFMSEYQDSLQHRKSFVGTVFYVAPEMLENQNVDRGCDFWALGIMIHKMITGKYLFEEANDYLTFEAIKKAEYQLSKDIQEPVRDLISRLLKKSPADRLGNGKKGSENDFQKLKEHPFFNEIDWELLRSSDSPLLLSEKDQMYDDMDEEEDSDLDEDKMLYSNNSQVEKKLIISGLVKKNKMYFLYNTRQLILYSNGTLEYFDPAKNILKGTITLDKSANCSQKSESNFSLNNGKRVYNFTTIDVPAKIWIEKISQTLSFM